VEGLDVLFVADDQSFDAMAETMKQTSRAYPLFDVARLVLNKPERHQVKLSRKPSADGAPRPLWRVVWDGQVYLTQQDAVQHVMRQFADRIQKKCETPIEPPKGNFTFVNRCSFTNIWLGPPNYHEYQQRIVRHHQQHLSNVPFEKFKARIQTVKDPEAVQAWLATMSTKSQYECQLCTENKPLYDDLVALQKHFEEHHLDGCIESGPAFTVPGPASRQLQHRGISGTIRTAWESERRFPLNTVAALRSALGKHGFAYFKHDKNVTYITKIRRKRFETLDGLADNIRGIVLFLRDHPHASRKQLVEHFLGPISEPAPSAATPAPDAPSAPADQAPAASAPTPSSVAEPAATPEIAAEAAAAAPTTETVPAPAESTTPAAEASVQSAEPKPAPIVTPEDKIMADLHWLIADGYVVEFSDGRLMAWPDAPPKPATPEPTETPAPATEPSAPAAEATPTDEPVATDTVPTPETTPSSPDQPKTDP
jgi:hypothetical protein